MICARKIWKVTARFAESLRMIDEKFAKYIFGEYRHFMKKLWGTYGVPAQ